MIKNIVNKSTRGTVFRHLLRKRGSSAVFLAIAFTVFALCIAGSIEVSRRLAVMSECEAFGRVWTRAVLSEYDIHLLEDYKLMAYWGNEIEVEDRIESYLDYSVADKLNISLGGTESDLAGYELGDAGNFRKAMKKGAVSSAASAIAGFTGRKSRYGSTGSDEDAGGNDADNGTEGMSGSNNTGRVIGNTVVLDTLPSGGTRSSFSTDSLIERAKSAGDEEGVRSAAAAAGIEALFMWQYFSSCVTVPDHKPHYFNNELEYIVRGSPDDQTNYEACRKRLFLARNALNLAALYKDPVKTELIISAAEIITPGPLGAATQLIIAEAWAALETEKDLEVLYKNGRVPVLKGPDQWQTDLDSVLGSSEVQDKLDEESRQLMQENSMELGSLNGLSSAGSILTEGLNYDEYLMLMILCVNSNTRLLRIMDIVQIDMKYRYYRDFNLMEYYTGVRFALTADGRNYVFEDSYK